MHNRISKRFNVQSAKSLAALVKLMGKYPVWENGILMQIPCAKPNKMKSINKINELI